MPGSRGYLRSATLKFESVKMSDSGVYQCSAKNEKGVSMATVNLEVYGKKCEIKLCLLNTVDLILSLKNKKSKTFK